LPSEEQTALWRYLDEIGYFVDENKQRQIMDRRLADLSSESYETVVVGLAEHLQDEIDDHPVSELDDALRQGLREALEALDFFESDEVEAELLGRPLGNLRREDLDPLAADLGQSQLAGWADLGLADLAQEEREAVFAHLQNRDWFVDRGRLGQLQTQPLRNLEGSMRQELIGTLRRRQVDDLRRRRLVNLDRDQRRTVHQILREQRVMLDEGQMRPLRRQQLSAMEREAYHDLLKDIGSQIVAHWGSVQFQDLDSDQRGLLSSYLGRRIMGRIERRVLLYTISRLWIDYLTDIEDLRRGIGLEAYGQRDPLVEYKRRAFELFEELGDNIRRTAVRSLFRQPPEPLAPQ
jgi:hypothetical protein